jgi:hypothetical protein
MYLKKGYSHNVAVGNIRLEGIFGPLSVRLFQSPLDVSKVET